MKVTVCFGTVRVVVPCGGGDFPISELIEKAVARYRKAIGQGADHWIAVHNLKSSSDSGILDPDDLLSDVADDREQIVAIFEEQGVAHHHNGGDGTSGSSVGTSSPDIFSGGRHGSEAAGPHKDFAMVPPFMRHNPRTDVIVTANDLNSNTGSTLIVRRGSEPVLNQIGADCTSSNHAVSSHPDPGLPPSGSNRWSAITSIQEMEKEERVAEDDTAPPPGERQGGNGQEKEADPDDMSFSTFARSSSRKSLNNNVVMYKWLEAQEKQQEMYELQQELAARKEPLGSAGKLEDTAPLDSSAPMSPVSHIITLAKSDDALGIHVMPVTDSHGMDAGLMVDGIEESGRVHRDGRLKPQDHIVEINGTSLMGVTFARAQEIFKNGLQSDELRLRVKSYLHGSFVLPPKMRSSSNQSAPQSTIKAPPSTPQALPLSPKSPPITPVRRHQKQSSLDETTLSSQNTSTPLGRRLSSPMRGRASGSSNAEEKEGSPKRSPPAIPPRAPTTSLMSSKGLISGAANTRQIGKKIQIQLTKGAHGLGFSVTTRDNPTRGSCPIYIKNIMSKGAAVEDGRLMSGDRLLEVNGEEVTGMRQADVVSILRNATAGSQVVLVVSRQVTEELKSPLTELNNNVPTKTQTSTSSLPAFPVSTPPATPPTQETGPLGLLGVKNREVHRIELPLHEAGSAGLGISVKGKTTNTEKGMQDLGIYIKSVLPGGAAAKKGCLLEEDQLIEVNDVSLLGKTNQEAMNILRSALQREGPIPGKISILIARRKAPPVVKARELKVSLSDSTLTDPKLKSGSDSSSKQDIGGITDVPSAFKPPLPVKQENGRLLNGQYGINPAIDRLSGNNLRNTSYQRANHDSMMSENTFIEATSSPLIKTTSRSTTNLYDKAPDKSDANHMHLRQVQSEMKTRPLSAVEHSKSVPDVAVNSMRTRDEVEEEIGDTTAMILEWDKKNTDVVEDSHLSPSDDEAPFQRDGFGRQSMSEKRKGHADPAASEFYQKAKQNKETRATVYSDAGQLKRANSAESLLSQTNPANTRGSAHERVMKYMSDDLDPTDLTDPGDRGSKSSKRSSVNSIVSKPKEVGPMLGLKKSSSLESLQTAVHEVSMEAEARLNHGGSAKSTLRGRGCNESFRAAVDHSYEEAGPETMETLDEEGSEAGSSSVGGRSRGSSFSNHDVDVKRVAKKTKDKEKRIFKGLGQMFRFGKARKTEDSKAAGSVRRPVNDLQTDIPLQKEEDYMQSNKKNQEVEKTKSKAKIEQERMEEQHRKMMQEKQLEVQRKQEMQRQQEVQRQQDMLQEQEKQRQQDAVRQADLDRLHEAQLQLQNHQQQSRHLEQQKSLSHGHLVTSSAFSSVPATPTNKSLQSNHSMPPPLSNQKPQYRDDMPPPSSTQKLAYREDMPPPREPPPSASRAEKIQFLRAEHQRRHRERQGQYPRDDEEEKFERQLQQFESHKVAGSEGYQDYPLPPRRREIEAYDRPASRQGYPPESSDSYSHYANFQEIQDQLHRHDYYQHQYHSQYPQASSAAPAPQQQQFRTPHHQRPPPYDPRSAQVHTQAHISRADGYYRDNYAPPLPATDSRYDPRYADQPARSQSQPGDPRSRGQDPRSWGQGYGERPMTQSPQRQVPAQTPINQLSYYPSKSSVSASSLHPPPQYDQRVRTYSEFDGLHSAYGQGYNVEPQFGSLPRRRDPNRDGRLNSGGSSAQV